MKVTYDVGEFFSKTKIVLDPLRLAPLGLFTENVSASFGPEEADEVLDFCAHHPHFHIVTYLGKGVYINRYDARGLAFKVAEGDADPDYLLNHGHVLRWIFPSC